MLSGCQEPPVALLLQVELSDTMPDFYVGDTFKPDGVTIRVVFSDSSLQEVTEQSIFSIGEVDGIFKSEGRHTVSVRFDNFKTTYSVFVKNKPTPVTLESISVLTPPDTIEYLEGETFSAVGLSLLLTYNNGNHDIVPFNGDNKMFRGDQHGIIEVGTEIIQADTITVQYAEMEASFCIAFKHTHQDTPPKVLFISLLDKFSYERPYPVSSKAYVIPEKMRLGVYYNNGTSGIVDVTNSMVFPNVDMGKAGTYNVLIKYNDPNYADNILEDSYEVTIFTEEIGTATLSLITLPYAGRPFMTDILHISDITALYTDANEKSVVITGATEGVLITLNGIPIFDGYEFKDTDDGRILRIVYKTTYVEQQITVLPLAPAVGMSLLSINPSDRTYMIGECFINPIGLVVEVTYQATDQIRYVKLVDEQGNLADGVSILIDGVDVSPDQYFVFDKARDYIVTVRYEKENAGMVRPVSRSLDASYLEFTYTVRCWANELETISFVVQGLKENYDYFDNVFTTRGVTLKATYHDGTERLIIPEPGRLTFSVKGTDADLVSGVSKVEQDTTILVSYNGLVREHELSYVDIQSIEIVGGIDTEACNYVSGQVFATDAALLFDQVRCTMTDGTFRYKSSGDILPSGSSLFTVNVQEGYQSLTAGASFRVDVSLIEKEAHTISFYIRVLNEYESADFAFRDSAIILQPNQTIGFRNPAFYRDETDLNYPDLVCLGFYLTGSQDGTEQMAQTGVSFPYTNNMDHPVTLRPIFEKLADVCKVSQNADSISIYGFCSDGIVRYLGLPKAVKYIGGSSFAQNSVLENIIFEPGSILTQIGENAFSDCLSLSSFHIDNDSCLQIIGHDAFRGSGLTSIFIPKTVSLMNSPFINCKSLETVVFEDNSQLKTLEAATFANCSVLKNVIFGEGACFTSIGGNAFLATAITSINIPHTVTSIGSAAFQDCKNLSTIIFEDGIQLQSIERQAFSRAGITSIKIPESVIEINNFAFSECQSLELIQFGTNSLLQTIGKYAFASSQSIISIKIPKSVTLIGRNAFSACKSLETVDFEDESQLQVIEESAFMSSGITSIVIPKGVESIGNGAFTFCKSLETVVFEDNSQLLTLTGFSNCPVLSNVVFGRNSRLQRIETNAFCVSGIPTIEIPNTVNFIGDFAFGNCSSLETIVIDKEKDSIEGAPWGARYTTILWMR